MTTNHGPIAELRVALKHPVAALLGAAIGGIVPLATYNEAHRPELLANPFDPKWLFVFGGLLFSAKTVWKWGMVAFDDKWKATGFVLLLEGVMVFSSFSWLAQTALGYLVAINAIATGCQFALRDQARREASERAVAATDDPAQASENLPSDAARRLTLAASDAWPAAEESGDPLQLRALTVSEQTGTSNAAESEPFHRAVEYVLKTQVCSISGLQRALRVGYPKAAGIVERLEREGYVGPRIDKAGASRRVLRPLPAQEPVSASG